MKKILIVNNNMHIGGVQKALVSLLWCIRDRFDVSLLLFCPEGECMKALPPEVEILTPKSAFRYMGMTKHDAHGIRDKLGRSFFASVSRLLGRKYAVKLMSVGQKKLSGYDVAISYLHDGGEKAFYGGCNDFVLEHVSAKKKITFLHCDYLLCGANTPENAKKYPRFEQVAACSQGCADAFLQANPHLRDKVRVVHNCHRFDQIRQAADAAAVTLKPDRINIVTVARLGKEKSVERALKAIAALGGLKERLHYWIVGDGVQKPVLCKIMEEEGLSRCVTLCGERSNPYGYMKAADLLLIPSISEAAPLVIGEAACLGTPVLSTETSSAKEMIERAGLGWVCENSVDGIRLALQLLLKEPDRMERMRSRLEKTSADNEAAIEQFARLLL